MKKFFLYLDESGDFAHDNEKKGKKNWSPSVIGGILLETMNPTGGIPEIFRGGKKNKSHGTEEDKDTVFQKFQEINNLNLKYVFFSNDECIKVINNNLTYQNIMAEGIIQLLSKLQEEYGEVLLNIMIAKRLFLEDDEHPNQKGNSWSNVFSNIVTDDQYVQKIQERLIMSAFRAGKEKETDINKLCKISLGNAREDDMLKIADIVCNTYLTRYTKFRDYKLIREVYDKEPNDRVYHFSVFPSTIEQLFQEAMADGRIGEAVTILCQCEDKKILEKNIRAVKEGLQSVSPDDLKVQYKCIAALVEHYINVEMNYDRSLIFLNNLLTYFVPILEADEREKQLVFQFKWDLYFYKLTVCTHKGDIKGGNECIEECDALLKETPSVLDMVDYQFRYRNRKIVHKIDQFDFKAASQECQSLISNCKDAKKFLNRLTNQKDVYMELGKAYSAQVQIYSFMLRHNPKLYKKAVKVSELAIEEMKQGRRQYLDRAMLEMEAGDFNRALLALMVAANVLSPEHTDIKEGTSLKIQGGVTLETLCGRIVSKLFKSKDRFLIANYIRLMTEGKLGGWDFADKMYELLYTDINSDTTGTLGEELSEAQPDLQHPYEIIYWKLATYCANIGEWEKAVESYKKALKVCFNGESDLTLNYIGFAVELERYAYTLKNRDEENAEEFKQLLIGHYNDLTNNAVVPDSMKDIFKDFLVNSESWEFYLGMSRRITY